MDNNSSKKRRASSPSFIGHDKTRPEGRPGPRPKVGVPSAHAKSKKMNKMSTAQPRPQAAGGAAVAGNEVAISNNTYKAGFDASLADGAVKPKGPSRWQMLAWEKQEAREILAKDPDAPGRYSRTTYCGQAVLANVSLLARSKRTGKLKPVMIDRCGSRFCSFCGWRVFAEEASRLSDAMQAARLRVSGSDWYFVVASKRIPGANWDELDDHYRASLRYEQLKNQHLAKNLRDELEPLGLINFTKTVEATASWPQGKPDSDNPKKHWGYLGGRLNTHSNFIFQLAEGACAKRFRRRFAAINGNALQLALRDLRKEGYQAFCDKLSGQTLWEPDDTKGGDLGLSMDRVSLDDLKKIATYVTKGVGGASAELVGGQLKRGRKNSSHGLFELLKIANNPLMPRWKRDAAKQMRSIWFQALNEIRPRTYSHSRMTGDDGRKYNWTRVVLGVEIDGPAESALEQYRDGALTDSEIEFIETKEETAPAGEGEAYGHKKAPLEMLQALYDAGIAKRRRHLAATLVFRGHIYSDFVLEHYFNSSLDERAAYAERQWNNRQRNDDKYRAAMRPENERTTLARIGAAKDRLAAARIRDMHSVSSTRTKTVRGNEIGIVPRVGTQGVVAMPPRDWWQAMSSG